MGAFAVTGVNTLARSNRRKQSFLDHIGDHVRAVTGSRFQSHILDVPFNRAGRYRQFERYFLRRSTSGDQTQDFGLSVRELGHRQPKICIHKNPRELQKQQ